jgi:hypothetical protein
MITDALRRGYLAGRSLDLHERESDVRKGSGQRLMFRSEAIAETFHETGNRIDCEGSLGKPRWLG